MKMQVGDGAVSHSLCLVPESQLNAAPSAQNGTIPWEQHSLKSLLELLHLHPWLQFIILELWVSLMQNNKNKYYGCGIAEYKCYLSMCLVQSSGQLVNHCPVSHSSWLRVINRFS